MERKGTFIFGISILTLSVILNFFTYRFSNYGRFFFYIILIEPVFSIIFLALYGLNRKKILKGLISVKWIILLFSAIFVWAYIVLVMNLGSTEVTYLMETLYYPSFFEQTIFALVGIETLSLYFKRGTSIIISALFYEAYYFVVLINSLPGFPGLYFPLFILDAFAIGLIYIGLYAVSKSIYVPMTLQISLLMMIVFIPPLPAAFFYTLVPS